MPHIVIESTPRLFVAIDFVTLFSAVHHRLAADGHAVLDDFKSRVHVTRLTRMVDRQTAVTRTSMESMVAITAALWRRSVLPPHIPMRHQ